MPGLSQVPWYQISVADIQNAQSGPLVSAFQATALASGQGDPTTAILGKVASEILGAIGFSGRYTMDASQGTQSPDLIPPNLLDWAVGRAVRLMRSRLEMASTPFLDGEQRSYDMLLGRLRRGEEPIDATNNPSGSNISIKPGTVTLNYGMRRQFTRHQLRNL